MRAPVPDRRAASSGRPVETCEIAVLIPCYNEEASIASVVRDFRATLPGATIYVYDNNSKDRTVELAREAGAVVRTEPLQGKGNVVRRMFADIEADVYVLVDGDDTYHAPSAPLLISKLVSEQLDMVNGARVTEIVEAYRPGHRFGNMMLTGIVAKIFGNRVADMLSGYRVFSRRFVKSFPALERRVRDRDGTDRPCAGTAHADVRCRYALQGPPARLRQQAADILRRLPHPEADPGAGEGGTPAPVLQPAVGGDGLHRAGAGMAGADDFPPDRSGAAAADGGAVHRPDAAGLPQPDLRPDPGNGDARPAGDKAHAVSEGSRSGRRRTRPGHAIPHTRDAGTGR